MSASDNHANITLRKISLMSYSKSFISIVLVAEIAVMPWITMIIMYPCMPGEDNLLYMDIIIFGYM